jgi:hypothetical protein
VLERVHLPSKFVQPFVIMRLNHLVPLSLQFVDSVFQIRLCVDDFLAEVNVGLFNAEGVGEFLHQLSLALSVNALDLREPQSFLTQLEHGHFFKVVPYHNRSFALKRVLGCQKELTFTPLQGQ